MDLTDQLEALARDPTPHAIAGALRAEARRALKLDLFTKALVDRGRVLAGRGLNADAVSTWLEAAEVAEEELDDPARAAEIYATVLEVDPDHRRALFAYGLLLHDLGRFDDLVKVYARRLARTADPGEQTTLLLYIAEIEAEKRNDPAAAFEHVKRAARLSPKNLRIIDRLQRLGEAAGRADEVAVVLGDLIMNQDEPRVRAGLALRLADLHMGALQDRERALAYFRAAIVDDGGNPDVLSEIGDVFGERARFAELAEILESVARERRTSPHRARLERELARIYEHELHDGRRALHALIRAAKSAPEDKDLMDEVLRVGMAAQAHEAVAEALAEVIQLTPNALLRTYLRLKLGHLLAGPMQRPREAADVYRAILGQDPGHREARRRLLKLHHGFGDDPAIVPMLEDEASLATSPTETLELLGRLLALVDGEQRTQVAQRILRIDPGHAAARAALEGGLTREDGRWTQEGSVMTPPGDEDRGRPFRTSTPSVEDDSVVAADEAEPEPISTAEIQAISPFEAETLAPEDADIVAAVETSLGAQSADIVAEIDAPAVDEPSPRTLAVVPPVDEAVPSDRVVALDHALGRGRFPEVLAAAVALRAVGGLSLVLARLRAAESSAEPLATEAAILRLALDPSLRVEDQVRGLVARIARSPELFFDRALAALEASGAHDAEVELCRRDGRPASLARAARRLDARLGRRTEALALVEAALAERFDAGLLGLALELSERPRRGRPLSELHGRSGESRAASAVERWIARAEGRDRAYALARLAELGLSPPSAWLERAFSLNPTDFDLADRLRETRRVAGDLAGALEVLEEQVAHLPSGQARAARLAEVVGEAGALGALERVRGALADRGPELGWPEPVRLAALDDVLRRLGADLDRLPVLERRLALETDRAERVSRALELAALHRAVAQPGDAALALGRALAIDPTRADLAERLLQLAIAEGRFGSAIKLLEARAAGASSPEGRAELLHAAGRLLEEELGDRLAALDRYERALSASPGSAPVLSALVRTATFLGLETRAAELSERLAELSEDPPTAARLFAKAGEYWRLEGRDRDRAATCFERALALEASDEVLARVGFLHFEARRFDRAIEALDRARAGLDPGSLLAQEVGLALGEMHLEAGRPGEAAEAYERVLAALPGSRRARLGLCRAKIRAADFSGALAAGLAVLAHDEAELDEPTRGEVFVAIAAARAGVGDPEDAARWAQRAHAFEALPAESLERLARTFLELEDPRRGGEALERLGRVDARRRRALLVEAADAYVAAAEPARAAQLLAELLLEHPADLGLSRRLARTKRALGEYSAAAGALLAAARSQPLPLRTEVLIEAADVWLEAQGRVARAREEAIFVLEEAHRELPDHPGVVERLRVLFERDDAPVQAAERLVLAAKTHAARPDASEERVIEWLSRAADLFEWRAHDPRAAAAALEVLASFLPNDLGIKERLALVVERAAAVDAGLLGRAAELWREIGERLPGHLEAARRLRDLEDRRGQAPKARIASELLALFGEAPEPPPPPAPPVGATAVEVPVHPAERSALGPVFDELGLALVEACADGLPEPKLKKRDRIELAALPPLVRAGLETTAAMFGTAVPPLYARDDALKAIQPVWAEGKPGILLAPALLVGLGGEAHLRFAIGWTFGLLRPGALALAVVPLDVVREALEGLVAAQLAPELAFSDARKAKKRAKVLERALRDGNREAVMATLWSWISTPGRASLFESREAVYRTAERMGAVAAGSLLVAADALRTAELVERRWLLPLIEFGSSRAYSGLVERLG